MARLTRRFAAAMGGHDLRHRKSQSHAGTGSGGVGLVGGGVGAGANVVCKSHVTSAFGQPDRFDGTVAARAP
jgi:hypothetical protein